jgi:hypothetical protein
MRDDAYKAHAPLTSADIQPTQNPNMRPKHSSPGNSHHQSSLYPLPRILPDPSRSTSRHLNLDTGLSPTEQPQSQSPQAWPSRSPRPDVLQPMLLRDQSANGITHESSSPGFQRRSYDHSVSPEYKEFGLDLNQAREKPPQPPVSLPNPDAAVVR